MQFCCICRHMHVKEVAHLDSAQLRQRRKELIHRTHHYHGPVPGAKLLHQILPYTAGAAEVAEDQPGAPTPYLSSLKYCLCHEPISMQVRRSSRQTSWLVSQRACNLLAKIDLHAQQAEYRLICNAHAYRAGYSLAYPANI